VGRGRGKTDHPCGGEHTEIKKNRGKGGKEEGVGGDQQKGGLFSNPHHPLKQVSPQGGKLMEKGKGEKIQERPAGGTKKNSRALHHDGDCGGGKGLDCSTFQSLQRTGSRSPRREVSTAELNPGRRTPGCHGKVSNVATK